MEKDSKLKNIVQEQFGRTAHEYVISQSHAKGDDLGLLIEWLSPNHDWTVLDIATGGGHVAKTLAPHVNTVFATDLTKQMLEAARTHLSSERLLNIHYVLADAESLPFLDNTFDAALCRIAPHHFPHPEKFISETFRILKPGGSFILIDNIAPNDESFAEFMNTFEKLRDKSHVRCASTNEWTTWITHSGFEILKSRSRKKIFEFVTWISRMAETEDQINLVEQYILSGPAPTQEYFNVQIHNGHIQSLQIDEWMVHCVKPISFKP